MASDQCDFSGNNTIYFYPDCRTAILGTFGPNGKLKKGHGKFFFVIQKTREMEVVAYSDH